MLDFNTMQMNEAFISSLDDKGLTKTAEQKGAEFLKLSVYEDSFHERIMPAQPVTPQQCDRDPNSPNYQMVIDKEFTDVTAVTMGFRGRSDYQFVETERYAVPFMKIESEEYHLTDGELRGMRLPIQNLIRNHIAYYIRKAMDTNFIGMCNAAISVSGNLKDLSASGEDRITPETLVALKNVITTANEQGRYLRPATLLMTDGQYNMISTWVQSNTAAGVGTGVGVHNGMSSDFWRDGYAYDKVLNLRIVRTVKSDLVNDEDVYLFTEPEYLGHHFTFNDDKFSIERRHDEMSWKGMRTYGAAIGNVNAVAKLKLAPLP